MSTIRETLLWAVGVGLLLTVAASAQEVFYPGNGVTLPTLVTEIHLMGATDTAPA